MCRKSWDRIFREICFYNDVIKCSQQISEIDRFTLVSANNKVIVYISISILQFVSDILFPLLLKSGECDSI